MRAFIHLPETGENFWDCVEEAVIAIDNISSVESDGYPYDKDMTNILLREYPSSIEPYFSTYSSYKDVTDAIYKASAGLALEKQISGNLEDEKMFVHFVKTGKPGSPVLIAVDKITHISSAGKTNTYIYTTSGENKVKGTLADICQKLAAAGCVIEKVKVAK